MRFGHVNAPTSSIAEEIHGRSPTRLPERMAKLRKAEIENSDPLALAKLPECLGGTGNKKAAAENVQKCGPIRHVCIHKNTTKQATPVVPEPDGSSNG